MNAVGTTVMLSARQAELLAVLAHRGRTAHDSWLGLQTLERLGLVERRTCGGLDPLWHPTPSGLAALRAWAADEDELADAT